MTTVKRCRICDSELERDPCEECGGDGGTGQSNCIDDMCNGGDVPCMHGDDAEYTCGSCDGAGGHDRCPVCSTMPKLDGPVPVLSAEDQAALDRLECQACNLPGMKNGVCQFGHLHDTQGERNG